MPEDEIDETVPTTAQTGTHRNVESMRFTGNMLIFRTPFGYASGLAYDLDQLVTPYILGTIAGADTVMVATAEDASRDEILDFFKGFVPERVIANARKQIAEASNN